MVCGVGVGGMVGFFWMVVLSREVDERGTSSCAVSKEAKEDVTSTASYFLEGEGRLS